MSKPRIVADDWPVVLVEWPRGRMDVADLSAHFAELNVLVARPGRVAFVMDLTGASLVDSVFRSRAASGLKAAITNAVTSVVGVAYVAPDPVVRGMLTAVHWVVSVPFPTLSVSSRAEALAWAGARLEPAASRRLPEDRDHRAL
jgi:hypothetical protein